MKRLAVSMVLAIVALGMTACGGGSTSPLPSATPPQPAAYPQFVNTYWYVPTPYLPAIAYTNLNGVTTQSPFVDQTVWYFSGSRAAYITGSAATNLGGTWNYSTISGSIVDANVSFGFYGSDLTTGTGTLTTYGPLPAFLMQMSAGGGSSGVTHYAYMLPVTSSLPQWTALPGYPSYGVENLFRVGSTAASSYSGVVMTSTMTGGTLYGSNLNDDLVAGPGNVTFDGDDGSDTLVGGGGTDTAVYAYPESAYTIARGTTCTVSGNAGSLAAGKVDTLTNVELLRFRDTTDTCY
jgi:hypothetical protein